MAHQARGGPNDEDTGGDEGRVKDIESTYARLVERILALDLPTDAFDKPRIDVRFMFS